MDPSKMKVVDLRSELGALGLDTKGNKPALVERLKKALEAKSGKVIPDTSILDTSTEDADEPATPRRPAPAPRTTRRSSSSRLAATPAKIPPSRDDPPEPIAEEPKPGGGAYSPSQEDSDNDTPEPATAAPEPVTSPAAVGPPSPDTVPAPQEPVKAPSPVVSPEKAPPTPVAAPEPVAAPTPVAAPEPVAAPVPVGVPAPVAAPVAVPAPVAPPTPVAAPEPVAPPAPVPAPVAAPVDEEPNPSGDFKNQSPVKGDTEPMEVQDTPKTEEEEKPEKKYDTDDRMEQDDPDREEDKDDKKDERERVLTEEEEWDQLNERLLVREQERLERERRQAEEDAKRMEDVSNDPVKLNRLKRKREKKARWSNFYRAVEVTNEVLTPPEESQLNKEKKESVEVKVQEPEINDNKITLSWYDSDLNQYLEVPELNGVVPLSEGAFSHAWAGTRASHGVDSGRVCYEVRVGTVLTTSEILEKENYGAGLRIGWSTEDSSLHLGEGELSWGFESTGRVVSNSEFKEYGKQLNEKDVVGAYLDLESNPCKISYTVNGAEMGTAFEFDKELLNGKAVFPHLLTKNMCYKVNFGYDRYNMLTKTKTNRKRVEIPVEQVLEEKRAIEAELQRQKEEAAKKDRERREKEKNEREERQKRKREEREKQDREKKEKEDAERKERGEEEPEAEGGDKDKEAEKDKEPEAAVEDSVEKEDEPMENGDKAAEVKEQPSDVKVEPMDAEPSEPAASEVDVKEELVPESELAEVTEEQVLKGHVLDKRIKFVTRYTVEEELDGSEVDLLPGYVLISNVDLVEGPSRPASIADCEVILMVGMPGSGKTTWAKQHAAAHPDKRYNILSTGALFDRMKVDCKPFRASYDGRWDAMVSKCAKCVLKLLEIAKGRKRNFILDQTNVYPSAQRRKLREFDGYRRVAVVIVTDDETYRDRQKRREEADGKEVPDGAIVDMKANFTLPEKCSWLDDVIYPELGADEARGVVDAYHREAKAAGVVRDKDKRERSATRDAPPAKRHRSNDKRHGRDERRNRDFSRGDREDRWGGSNSSGGGGGGGRWSGAGGRGGSRWGPRDSRAPAPPNAGRFDRPWQGPPQPQAPGGNGGGRYDNDFRSGSGRGGRGGGGRGDRGGRGGAPPGNDRFGRERHNRPNDRQDKRHHQPGNTTLAAEARATTAARAPGSAGARQRAARGPLRAPASRTCDRGGPTRRTDRIRTKIKTNRTSKDGTNGPADGVAGATGIKTKVGATGVTGAIGATHSKARVAPEAQAGPAGPQGRRGPPDSSGLPTIQHSSGTSGSNGSSNNSRPGPGINRVTRLATPRTRRRGHNTIRTTVTKTRITPATRSPAARKSDPRRGQTHRASATSGLLQPLSTTPS